MSAPTPVAGTAAAPEEERGRGRWRLLGLVAAFFVMLCVVRVVTGADQLTTAGTLGVTLVAAMPIAMAGLGGLWSERAGVVNIGLEGMMIMGTLGAGFFGYNYGLVAGVLGAVLLGALGGVVHAVATVVFGVDHIVSGVAINLIAAGLAGFMAAVWFTGTPGGGPRQSPPLPTPPTITVPGVSDLAATVSETGWFLVSDLANVVRMLTTQLSSLVLICLLLLVLSWWVLWRTTFGLRLRSCGEAPIAAETLGVNVYRYKFIAVTISGGFAGLGGALLAMVSSSIFQTGQTGGQGYIGLAAMIFGNWTPAGLLGGSLLFGYTGALQFRQGEITVHALLLFVVLLLVVVAIWQLRRGQRRKAIGSAVFAVVFLAWYLLTEVVPSEFTEMAPYVTTLLVLAFASQRLRMPAADGQVYRKGSAG